MSHSIDILDQRTQKDMRFVENMEFQLKNMEKKFKEVEDGHESNSARQYMVYIRVFHWCGDICICESENATSCILQLLLHKFTPKCFL